MRLLKKNDGITILELVITIGIAAILLTMIAMIINTATKSYKNTTNNTSLQKEAQVVINQLSGIIMEAESITYGTAISPNIKYLIQGSGDNTCYAVYFEADKNRLYLISATDLAKADSMDPTLDEALSYEYLLAENVESLKIEVEAKSAKLYIKLAFGDASYTGQKRTTMRNKK